MNVPENSNMRRDKFPPKLRENAVVDDDLCCETFAFFNVALKCWNFCLQFGLCKQIIVVLLSAASSVES